MKILREKSIHPVSQLSSYNDNSARAHSIGRWPGRKTKHTCTAQPLGSPSALCRRRVHFWLIVVKICASQSHGSFFLSSSKKSILVDRVCLKLFKFAAKLLLRTLKERNVPGWFADKAHPFFCFFGLLGFVRTDAGADIGKASLGDKQLEKTCGDLAIQECAIASHLYMGDELFTKAKGKSGVECSTVRQLNKSSLKTN